MTNLLIIFLTYFIFFLLLTLSPEESFHESNANPKIVVACNISNPVIIYPFAILLYSILLIFAKNCIIQIYGSED